MTQTAEKLKLRPLSNRVLAERLKEEGMKGSIILPESSKKTQDRARVVAVGEGKRDKEGTLVPPPVTEGDMILIEKYSGQEVTIEDQEYVIIRGDDIIAVIE